MRIAKASNCAKMFRRFQIEDLNRTVILRGQKQAIAIVIDGEVIKVSGITRKIDRLDKFDGGLCLRVEKRCS
jgi:hypothetical protein